MTSVVAYASQVTRGARRAYAFLRRTSDRSGLHLLGALVLGAAGRTKAASSVLSKLISSVTTQGAIILLTRTEGIIAAIDWIAFKDESSAARLRASLRAGLFGSDSTANVVQTGSFSKLKLAYVSNSPVPSSAANCVHAIKMCAALRRQGIDVTLFAESSSHDPTLNFKHFDVVEEFDFVRIERASSGMQTDFRKAYSAVHTAPTHLFTRSPKVAYLAALWGIPTLLEMHAPPARSLVPFVRDLSRLPAFRGMIVITAALREEIRSNIPDLGDKTYVIPDAADPPKADVAAFDLVKKTATAALHVGYVGHLYPGKGLEVIVELAARLPTFMFHILGGDPADVGRWKQAKGASENIVFYGHRPHADVPAFLSAIDVAVAPYLRQVFARGNMLDIARWMSPMKLFEYMASAKAIVSSDLPVLREVLANGRNALLVDPDNLDRWVETLELLRADPGLRQALGREARKDFEQNFTWSRRAERILCRLVGEKEAYKAEFFTHGQRSTGDEATRASRSRAGKSVPSIWWFYEDKLSGWAYGINSRRLASRLKDFDHYFGSQPAQRGDGFDLMVCLDILNYAEKRGTASDRTIMRIGGPKPLMQIGGKDLGRLKDAFADFAAIIAVSPELEAAAAAFHPNVFLIPNGTDLRLWHPVALQGCDERRSFRAGFAAAVKTADQRQVKGVDIARTACKRAGIELIVVGRGGDQVPHDRMIADFYSEIDVLVHPVGPGKEGSSNVIMECLALGVPVITTAYAGYHADKLRDRHDVLFARRDHESFAAALIEIQNNRELRNQLSTGGRAFAEAHHNLDLIGRQYEEVFRFALGMDKPNKERPC